MKKIVSYVKSNWYYFLFIIPFINICIINRSPSNDIWFLLNNGRYVLNHWIPYVDPFTIHEGLTYVMQQWLTSVVFYTIFKLFGEYGLLTFVLLFSSLIMAVYYKLCYSISHNKFISVVVTVVLFTLFRSFFVLRPQLFTYVILLIELLCMEKYIKKKDWKHLIPMPILSLLLINLHASMWLLQFVFVLPVLCNCLKIKGITIDEVKIKPLLITVVLMFLVGFINPYGYKAIMYVFYSYNIPDINKLVEEMAPITFESKTGKLFLLLLLGVGVLINYSKKIRLDIRHILFLCGTAILAFMHSKCVIYFVFYAGYIIVYLIQSFSLKKIDNKYLYSFVKGFIASSCVCLSVAFMYALVILYQNYQFRYSIADTVDYILDNYESDEVVLFVDYDYGGYTEYKGLKSYMDPRAELFSKRFNKKEDIIREALSLEKTSDEDYEKFVKKYNFTHLIINNYLDRFIEFMKKNEDYVLEYEQKNTIGEYGFTTDYLFVRKDISKENN